MQVLLARMSITFIIGTAYMWWANVEGFPWGDKNIRKLLHVRGISGLFSGKKDLHGSQTLGLQSDSLRSLL